jgi:arylsulfatase A
MRIGAFARWSFAAIVVAVIPWTASPLSAATPVQPNVVFFLADDIGFGDLAYHGNRQLKTPHLDSFAK